MLTPKEYIEKYYKNDIKNFGNDEFCGVTFSQFYDDEKREKWPYLDHFLICQYELNLLSQVIYTHFKIDYEKWSSVVMPFNSCRCSCRHGGVGHPLSILWVAERDLTKHGSRFEISKSLILEYDKYFLNYIKEICNNNDFIDITLEKIIAAIKSDPDCNKKYVKEYFSKK